MPVDTALYIVGNNISGGSGNFKRLTFDICTGWETPVGYEIFLYTEARLHIPTSDYPSHYLFHSLFRFLHNLDYLKSI